MTKVCRARDANPHSPVPEQALFRLGDGGEFSMEILKVVTLNTAYQTTNSISYKQNVGVRTNVLYVM